jgi:glyoxylase-like metal-dependent hydrolase (beta-lactamase superfamily II)
MTRLLCGFILVATLSGRANAQSTQTPDGLKQYVPVLPSVREKFWKIDPKLGYAMKGVGGGVYVMTDDMWQSAFLVTDDGVIVFDAPESFGAKISSAVASVTDKPIEMLIYSHIHKDHIGGSAALKDIKGLRIVASSGVAKFLTEQNDPNRLIPNEVFDSQKTIKMGGKTVELTVHHYHSNEGDLFIYVPEAKFLMAIDCVTSGYIPFSGFDITTNFDQYLKVFDQLLADDFNTFVGGHLTDVGTRKDVEETKEFTMDVYQTVKRIHNNLDQQAVVAEAAKTIGTDNKFLLFKVILDRVSDQAVAELRPRWINRLAGVDVWLDTQVRTALIYVRWDDKVAGTPAAALGRDAEALAGQD